MQVNVATTKVIDVYKLLVGLVTPRPIAWVSTVSPAGVANLAPFSFYNTFGANPPVVVFSPTLRRDGSKKDTLRNVEATGEFVINAAVDRLREKINLTSQELPFGESEFQLAGLEQAASASVKPPRVADAPFALECRCLQIMPIGNGPISANLVIGEVVSIYLSEHLLDADGRPDPRQIQAVARLGGDDWCRTTDLFQLERPR